MQFLLLCREFPAFSFAKLKTEGFLRFLLNSQRCDFKLFVLYHKWTLIDNFLSSFINVTGIECPERQAVETGQYMAALKVFLSLFVVVGFSFLPAGKVFAWLKKVNILMATFQLWGRSCFSSIFRRWIRRFIICICGLFHSLLLVWACFEQLLPVITANCPIVKRDDVTSGTMIMVSHSALLRIWEAMGLGNFL